MPNSTEIIPTGQDRGEFRITDQMMWETGAASMGAFEILIREEAMRRGLELSVSEESFSRDLVVRWRPDKHAHRG